MKVLKYLALILLIIGGLNWGLVGVFNFDLVASVFGGYTTGARVVYTLVGLSAIWKLICVFKCCGECKGK